MARSRVGGSTAKLSGKVGDVIYSITRNPDGTFRQMVSANPEERFNPNTDAQARARMTMAMIERAMFTYRDFMGTGFENVDLGTNNVSKFSEVNYNTIKYDIETYWDVEDWPDWNYDFPRKGQTTPKDGCFIISQGSLRTNLKLWPIGATDSRRWFGIESNVMIGDRTVRSFLDLNGLEPGMQYVAIFFCQGTTPSKSFVAYLTLWTDETVNLNAELNSSNWRNYLKTYSNVTTNSYFNNETGQLVHICDQLDAYSILRTGCFGQRLRIRRKDRFLYNTCEMQYVTYSTPQEDWGWKTLWDVKDSWIEQPVPPTPTHRIPLEYQEVLYITAVGDVEMLYDITLNMSKMSMEFKISSATKNWGFVVWTGYGVGRFCFISRDHNNKLSYMIRSKDRNANVETTVNGSFILNRTYSFLISTDDNGYVITLDGVTESYPNSGAIIDNDFTQVQIFGATGYYFKGSLYEILIRDKSSSAVLHDLVPCYRKNDGAIGFYDISDSYFLTVNNSQTKMTYGPIVNPT